MKQTYLLGAFFTIFLLALPIYGFNPDLINPDTYFYISIANGYLFHDGLQIRDAFTVGPILPLFIATVKYFLLFFLKTSPELNVALVKSLAIFCYVSITCLSIRILEKRAGVNGSYPLLLVLIPWLSIYIGTDTISLNGELFSVPFLLLLVLVNDGGSKLKESFCLILAIFILYIKLQSLIIILLILGRTNLTNKKQINLKLLFLFCVLVAVVESILFRFEIGYVWNSKDLFFYILNNPSLSNDVVPNGNAYLQYLFELENKTLWMIKTGYLMMPFLTLIPAFYFMKFVHKKYTVNNVNYDVILYLLIIFLTTIIPTRNFSHYLLYFLFFYYISFAFIINNKAPNKFLISSAFVISVLISNTSMHSLSEIRNAQNRSLTQTIQIGPEFQEVIFLLGHIDKSEIFVHGYDYRIYAAFDSYDKGFELPYVIGGLVSESDYIEGIKSNKPKYLIDVVQYSGFLRDPKYALENNLTWKVYIRENYKCIYNKSGLKLYELQGEDRE